MAPKKRAAVAAKEVPAAVPAGPVPAGPRPTPAKAAAATVVEAPKPKASAKVAAQPLSRPSGSAAMEVEEGEQKRKAPGLAGEASPPAKKAARLEATEESAPAFPELELDATEDARPVFSAVPAGGFFEPKDSTLNVLPMWDGDVLMALSHGGLQYLIAGARASVGVKAGRHAFAVRIVDAVNLAAESTAAALRAKVPQPRQLMRVGFSTAGSPLVLGTSEEHVCFDLDGSFFVGGKATPSAAKKCSRDEVFTVVLNLDATSSNANTISLFSDGRRISEPKKLPEQLHGKTLFPHVAFRNVGVHVHLGPELLKELPFRCRTIVGAAEEDVESNAGKAQTNGKYEVVLPVAFPDEGTFDWLDTFLQSHPEFTELSDRMILEWARLSGLIRPTPTPSKTSNDNPEFNFGIASMDDYSIQRVLGAVVSAMPRNYVVMEVKSNLVADERKETLDKFSSGLFHKVAQVIMGEPTEAFKAAQVERFLKEKQQRVAEEWKAKKQTGPLGLLKPTDAKARAEELRQRIAAETKRKAAAMRKKAELARRRAAGEEILDDEEDELAEESAAKDGADAEGEVKGEDEPSASPMEDEDGPPEVELTEEERSRVFRIVGEGSSDLLPSVLNKFFSKFSIPDKAEGFDEVRFEWQDEAASKDYLRKWVLEKKRSSRIEYLEPGEWFQETQKVWTKKFSEWQAKQKTSKVTAMRVAKERAAKKKAEQEKLKELGVEEDGAQESEEKPEDIDPFSVPDICDVGDGLPLFKDFAMEDWALLQLRHELYILQEAFRKDVDDPDIAGIQEQHLPFYYHKYFRKSLMARVWGVSSTADVVALAKESVEISAEGILVPKINAAVEDDSAEAFVKLTEESRRERLRRMDAGDETAKLKFLPMALQQASNNPKAAPKVSAWSALGSSARSGR